MSIEQKIEVICGNVPPVAQNWGDCAVTKLTKGLLQSGGLGTLVEPAARIGAINEDLLSKGLRKKTNKLACYGTKEESTPHDKIKITSSE